MAKKRSTKAEREAEIAADFERLLQEDARKELHRISQRAYKARKKFEEQQADAGQKEYRTFFNKITALNIQSEKTRNEYGLTKRRSKIEIEADRRSKTRGKGVVSTFDFSEVWEYRKQLFERLKKKQVLKVNGKEGVEALTELTNLLSKIDYKNIKETYNPQTKEVSINFYEEEEEE